MSASGGGLRRRDNRSSCLACTIAYDNLARASYGAWTSGAHGCYGKSAWCDLARILDIRNTELNSHRSLSDVQIAGPESVYPCYEKVWMFLLFPLSGQQPFPWTHSSRETLQLRHAPARLVRAQTAEVVVEGISLGMRSRAAHMQSAREPAGHAPCAIRQTETPRGLLVHAHQQQPQHPVPSGPSLPGITSVLATFTANGCASIARRVRWERAGGRASLEIRHPFSWHLGDGGGFRIPCRPFVSLSRERDRERAKTSRPVSVQHRCVQSYCLGQHLGALPCRPALASSRSIDAGSFPLSAPRDWLGGPCIRC